MPHVKKRTEKRNKAIDNFLKEFTIEQFEEICKIANSSDFLIGINERGWKADFDFIMRVDKATAILEGKYANKEPVKEKQHEETEEEAIARKTKALEEELKNADW